MVTAQIPQTLETGMILLAALALNSILLPGGVAIYSGPAEHVLLTSTRRDLLPPAAPSLLPAGEAAALEDPAKFWRLFAQLRFHDYAQKTTKVPVEPRPVARTVRGGDVLTFGPTKITVLDTPGYSPAAVSYLFEQNGKRVIATATSSTPAAASSILYSLQNEVPETKTRGYHGFAARAGQLIASLRSVAAQKPDRLLPAAAPPSKSRKEIALLISRLERLDSHFSTDALRWYWAKKVGKPAPNCAMGRAPSAPMPMSEQRDLPDWIIHRRQLPPPRLPLRRRLPPRRCVDPKSSKNSKNSKPPAASKTSKASGSPTTTRRPHRPRQQSRQTLRRQSAL
jgi:glyoxylase-like metal-dependent hydrolase (beta-lactamase superfamily II)